MLILNAVGLQIRPSGGYVGNNNFFYETDRNNYIFLFIFYWVSCKTKKECRYLVYSFFFMGRI